MSTVINYTAPATAMLFGEHAVVHGHPAIAIALDKTLTASLTPRSDHKIIINSDKFGQLEINQQQLPHNPTKPFDFITACINTFKDDIEIGFDLQIASNFSATIGFGSSAAVIAATLQCLNKFTQSDLSKKKLFKIGKQIIQDIQGSGSGTDLACSLTGGVIYFDPQTNHIEKLANTIPISLVYSGYKTPTGEVIKKLNDNFSQEQLQPYFEKITACVNKAKQAIPRSDWQLLGEIANQQQAIMAELGLSCETLTTLISQANQIPGITGSKISGSGLGDCIVTICKLPEGTFPLDEIQAAAGIVQFDMSY